MLELSGRRRHTTRRGLGGVPVALRLSERLGLIRAIFAELKPLLKNEFAVYSAEVDFLQKLKR